MRLATTLLAGWLCASAAAPLLASEAQTQVDRADPSVVEEELKDPQPAAKRPPRILQVAPSETRSSALEGTVAIGAIRIDGARALSQASFASVIERYVGRTLSPSDLRALATGIAGVAREAGYGLATAWIPPQQVGNGVLRVGIDEGTIDALDVTGTGSDAVKARLAPLADGEPLKTAELERRLLIADDLPGIRLGKAKLVHKGNRNVLVLSAVKDRVEGRVQIDNWGTGTSGPVRARLSVDINALLADDDRLSVEAVTTPLEPNELALGRAAYTVSLGTGGTEVTVGGYVARSEAGAVLSARDFDGKSSELEAEVRHPLIRSRDASVWAGVAGSLRNSEQTRQDIVVRDDRVITFTGSLYGFQQLANGRLRGRLAFVQGVDILGATRASDPLRSRSDADGRFSKLEFWGEFEHRLGYDFSILLQAEGQLVGGPLLSSEEMGLGGRAFGRAWDFREYSGDRGIASSLELRFDWEKPLSMLEMVQLYAYLDGGTVANLGTGTGGGSLASVGLGTRLWLPSRIRASAQLGIPLTQSTSNGKRSDPRLSVTFDKKF